MTLSPDTRKAIDLCYDAIVVPCLWPDALERLALSLDAHACQIIPHEVSERSFGVLRSPRIERLTELWNKNLEWVTDVYVERGQSIAHLGYRAVIQSQLFSDEEILHSRFHQEIAGPAGCLHWACSVFDVEGRTWCMPIVRSSAPFSSGSKAPLVEVAEHMARIVSIAEKIARATSENDIITLEKAGYAAVLVDRKGRARRANRLAEDLFCNEFGVRNGRLWALSSANLERLSRFLAAIEYARSEEDVFPPPIVLKRGNAPWLLLEAMPLSNSFLDMFDGCRAVVAISDLTRPSYADAAILGLLFGLTKAEARLAEAICKGHDIASAAREFGVSRETLRGQLKTVFAKTGSRRQAELVARLSRIRSPAKH